MANPLPSSKAARDSTERSVGSSIAGERIAAQARKYVSKPSTCRNGVWKETGLFKVNAFCVVERPLEILQRPSQETKSKQPVPLVAAASHNSIHGEAILGEAMTISYKGLATGSSKHKIQKYALSGSCYCVIRKELIGLHHSRV